MSATSDWATNAGANVPAGVQKTFICDPQLGTDETIKRGFTYCPDGWKVEPL